MRVVRTVFDLVIPQNETIRQFQTMSFCLMIVWNPTCDHVTAFCDSEYVTTESEPHEDQNSIDFSGSSQV